MKRMLDLLFANIAGAVAAFTLCAVFWVAPHAGMRDVDATEASTVFGAQTYCWHKNYGKVTKCGQMPGCGWIDVESIDWTGDFNNTTKPCLTDPGCNYLTLDTTRCSS